MAASRWCMCGGLNSKLQIANDELCFEICAFRFEIRYFLQEVFA